MTSRKVVGIDHKLKLDWLDATAAGPRSRTEARHRTFGNICAIYWVTN